MEIFFDECISGRNIGKCGVITKPNCIPYKLTYAFALTVDNEDFDKEDIDIETLKPKELLPV